MYERTKIDGSDKQFRCNLNLKQQFRHESVTKLTNQMHLARGKYDFPLIPRRNYLVRFQQWETCNINQYLPIMTINLLAKKTYQLNIGHEEMLQEVVVYSPEIILMVFQERYQLWNIHTNSMLLESKINQNIFDYCQNTLMNDHKVAFIHYASDKKRHLCTYDLKSNQIQYLMKIADNNEDIFEKLICLDDGTLVIRIQGASNIILFKDGKTKRKNPSEKINRVQKYDMKNGLVYYDHFKNHQNGLLKFTILQGQEETKYQIQGAQFDYINSIKEFDQFRAIVLVQKEKNFSLCYLVSLKTGVIQKSFKFGFDAKYLYRHSLNRWFGCKSVEDQFNSELRAQECFVNSAPSVTKIPYREIIGNDFFACFTIQCKNKIAFIETEKILNKDTYYIGFLEYLGFIDEFGKDIVKMVINNLN